ncbi:MAG: hypothetical protein JWM95_4751 [Gemmatimonadetes bacterium]|nr:hypothetical protein [Gemmatimonadota bacterium]
MSTSALVRVLAVAGLAAAAPVDQLHAQTIAIAAGAAASTVVLPGGKVTVPVIIDITNATTTNIASLASAITWGASRLTLDSLRVVPALGWTFTPDLTGAAGGSSTFTASNGTALAATATLANAFFTASANSGGTRVIMTPSAAANVSAQSILALLQPRGLDVCVAVYGKWGDANNDNTVNIIDAQQIARTTVGLSVANAAAVSAQGDVNADASVNIIDAQQIARFSVALSAAARVNTVVASPPVVASATLAPGATQNLSAGGTVRLSATPRDAASGDITGCASFTWSSSNTAVATVNADGFVTAVSGGTAAITATSATNPAVTASLSVVVAAGASTIHLTMAHSGRTARQYIAQVTGPGITDYLGFIQTVSAANGGTMDLVMPTSGTFAVKVVALDAASPTNNLFLAGGQFSMAVPASGTVNKSLTLVPATYTMTTFSTKAAIGAPIPVAWSVTDPSGAMDARGSSFFCGVVQSSTSALTSDFSGGTSTNACTLDNPQSGTVTYSTFLASQPSPTIVNLVVRATQNVRAGVADVFVNWVNPSVSRGETPLAVTVAPIASIAVTPALPTVTVGNTQTMTATPRDSVGATVSGWPVTWSSSAPAVATISAAGVVTAVANGTTTITAAAGGITGTTTITVNGGANVGSISVSLGNSTLSGNATTLATPTVRDPQSNVIVATVTWSSSVPTVARVAANGTVTALGTGTTNITATIGNVVGSATFTVNQVAAAFNIEVRPVGTMPAAANVAFAAAAARWSQIIRGDEPNQVVNNLNVAACGFDGVPNITETIDDLVIYVKVAPIDGPGGTQAQGGPCYIRSGTGHAYVGLMILDAADVTSMDTGGILFPVVLHEMGHVLGIGTNWSSALLPNRAPDNPDPAGDPVFVGANAQWAFQNLGTGYGGAIVPVENCCSTGTRNAHWRESVLKRELMTGFTTAGGGLNPLSPLTAASLLDLGYVVDVSQSDAVPYFDALPVPGQQRVQIRELPLPVTPFVTDASGRVISGGDVNRRVP